MKIPKVSARECFANSTWASQARKFMASAMANLLVEKDSVGKANYETCRESMSRRLEQSSFQIFLMNTWGKLK